MNALHMFVSRWFQCCNISPQKNFITQEDYDRKQIEFELMKKEMSLVENEEQQRQKNWNCITYNIKVGISSITESVDDVGISLQGIVDMIEERNELIYSSHCSICFGTIKNVICYPCKHVATCLNCQRKIKDSRCVICRQEVHSYTNIYF